MKKIFFGLAIAASILPGSVFAIAVNENTAFATHKEGHNPGGGSGGGAATDLNCVGCVEESELAFNTANQTELDSHSGDVSAHHVRYSDSEAVAATGPHLAITTHGPFEVQTIGFGSDSLVMIPSDNSMCFLTEMFNGNSTLSEDVNNHCKVRDNGSDWVLQSQSALSITWCSASCISWE